jgi:predicted nucleic acid-binding protein
MDKVIVIDASVVISGLISGKPWFGSILSNYELIAPDFLAVELSKYAHIISKKTKLEPDKVEVIFRNLLNQIELINFQAIGKDVISEANELCSDIDIKDSPYVAVSLFASAPILTRDKKLVESLRLKGYKAILLLEDIFKDL